MTRGDVDRIASEYFDDKESEHEMDEVFYLAKKALEERKEDMLDKIRAEIAEYKDDKIIHAERNEMIDIVLDIIDKYMGSEG